MAVEKNKPLGSDKMIILIISLSLFIVLMIIIVIVTSSKNGTPINNTKEHRNERHRSFIEYRNEMRGNMGEYRVNAALNPLIFGKVNHRQINNLIILDERNKSHQIDHIEIRKNGIFCIETKNYKGLILGDENQKEWTQCLFRGERHQLINPVKQNKSHIYHLHKILGNKYKINSVIVFVRNNADGLGIPYVINLNQLKRYLDNFNDGTHLSDEEMDTIQRTLLNHAARITKEEHIRNINATKQELENGICPRCGGKLVERNGKYGKFFGCSNYPKCKFIKKL